jgi:hypothetical protein
MPAALKQSVVFVTGSTHSCASLAGANTTI